MKDGKVAKDYAMWQEMIRDPEKHWSWNRKTAAIEQPYIDEDENDFGYF